MFILLGTSDDPCLAAVAAALTERGRDAAILTHPFADGACSALRFDTSSVDVALSIGGKAIAIEAVLASRRALPRVTPSEQWAQPDLLYSHAEAEAALLGWLWGLPCPVIDRWPAWLWYQTRRPMLAWAAMLAQAGLVPLDSVISADADELARFAAPQGGAAIDPPAAGIRQAADTDQIAALSGQARQAPIRLAELHRGAWRACLAGPSLVWDDGTPAEAERLAPRLRAFAARVEMSCIEFIITSDAAPRIVDITAQPRFELFGPLAQRAIAGGLAEALVQAGQRRAAS